MFTPDRIACILSSLFWTIQSIFLDFAPTRLSHRVRREDVLFLEFFSKPLYFCLHAFSDRFRRFSAGKCVCMRSGGSKKDKEGAARAEKSGFCQDRSMIRAL